MAYDRAYWEQRWAKTLREHPGKVAQRPPNAHLIAGVGGLRPGRSLDAGCGNGSETLWLAAHGWEVTAVDFSASALAHARSTAAAMGPDVAGRIAWVEGDLAVWTPPRECFDLVACLYVHVPGSVDEMVRRLASGVAPGGTLFMVGHRPVDPATGKPMPAAGQVQVSVESAGAALDLGWELVVAEERPRAVAGTGVDAVIIARRRMSSLRQPPAHCHGALGRIRCSTALMRALHCYTSALRSKTVPHRPRCPSLRACPRESRSIDRTAPYRML
jgi:SAM-dependent methyltransferase